METKNCIVCNKEMVKRPNHDKVYWASRKYCSNECNHKDKVGLNHPNWKGGKPLVVCKHCGKEFIGRLGKEESSFCSKYCNASFHMKGNRFRDGLSPINKGIKMDEAQVKKLSIAKIGVKRKPYTEATRNKLSIALRGKERLSQRGENHHNWKGGISKIADIIRGSIPYREWRRSVFKRDNYTCQQCGNRSGKGNKVIIHSDHIKPFSLFPELRFDINNGRTLCEPCHRKTPTFGQKALKLKTA